MGRRNMVRVNEAGRLIAITFVSGILASLAASATALAQAGSTGGTIGKQDKSVSGEGNTEAPDRKLHHAIPASPREGAVAVIKQTTFTNPTINGIRVDRCWHFATECDEPAATHWCQSKGFTRAVESKWEYMSDTIGQSDSRRCPIPGACGGFSKIVCE
jgi:hypothetical protein